MAGDTITLTDPARVRDAVQTRRHQLGLLRADIRKRCGTWTYDRLVKADPGPHRVEMLEKLSLALDWRSDGIARIDRGSEPVELAGEPTRAALEESLADLRAEVSRLAEEVRRLREAGADPGGRPGRRRTGGVP